MSTVHHQPPRCKIRFSIVGELFGDAMPQDAPVRPISIVGLILFVLGICSLVYFEAPSSLMVQAVAQHQNGPLPLILGGAAVLVGVALLFAGRPPS
jgi:hypothetical protein